MVTLLPHHQHTVTNESKTHQNNNLHQEQVVEKGKKNYNGLDKHPCFRPICVSKHLETPFLFPTPAAVSLY